MDTRARKAEERFDEVNEQLHHSLIRNRNLERELEELVKTTMMGSQVKTEDAKENQEDRGGKDDDEHQQTQTPPTSAKKEAQPTNSSEAPEDQNTPEPKPN